MKRNDNVSLAEERQVQENQIEPVSSSWGSPSSPPTTPNETDIEDSDPCCKDVALEVADVCLLQYQMERQSCSSDNYDGITEKDEIIKHLKRTNDKLLLQANAYKKRCEEYEQKMCDMRSENNRKVNSIKSFYYNVLLGHSRSSVMLKNSLSE